MIPCSKQYIAISHQHDITMFLGKHPRKELMECHGVKSAKKMYVGDGDHIGYIVAGNWYTLYAIEGIGIRDTAR